MFRQTVLWSDRSSIQVLYFFSLLEGLHCNHPRVSQVAFCNQIRRHKRQKVHKKGSDWQSQFSRANQQPVQYMFISPQFDRLVIQITVLRLSVKMPAGTISCHRIGCRLPRNGIRAWPILPEQQISSLGQAPF
jgi:hypothetical protein